MKNIFKLVVLLFIVVLMNSCDENNLVPLINDGLAPGKVEIKSTRAIPGGLEVEYTLPVDKDLMYVKAVYTLTSGKTSEVKASYFNSKITITGFGDTLEHSVKLYAVDRGENISEPVEITGKPLLAPIKLTEMSMNIKVDFGGARFTWKNVTGAPLMILIFAEDSMGRFKQFQTVYSSEVVGKFNLRGLKSVPTRFAAVVRDRWDNYSDTINPLNNAKLTPLFEQRLDKTKMRAVTLSNDVKWDAWGFKFENIFDDNYTTLAHTQGDHPFPQIMTIDLGVKVKLSRFKVYQRGPNDVGMFFAHGNPLTYDVYGLVTLPNTSGNLTEWVKLRDLCKSIKPTNADEAKAKGLDGDEFDFDQSENPIEIRYFRWAVLNTWENAGYINVAEMSFWGSITETYN